MSGQKTARFIQICREVSETSSAADVFCAEVSIFAVLVQDHPRPTLDQGAMLQYEEQLLHVAALQPVPVPSFAEGKFFFVVL
jgi:hypothetical protein